MSESSGSVQLQVAGRRRVRTIGSRPKRDALSLVRVGMQTGNCVSAAADSSSMAYKGAQEIAWQPLPERSVPRSWIVVKRGMDIMVALALLVVSAPIVIVAIVCIMINSPGSPFFAQERVGRYGRRFMMYKLRTMRPNAQDDQELLRSSNEATGPVFKMRNDPRVFFVGRLVRKLSIDELPNLVSVLLGQMSIVGPRPPLPSEVEGYTEYAWRRLRAKPGITCIWQISGRSGIDFNEWMKLDHSYIDNWSPAYDLKIMLSTIPAVLAGKGAY